MFIFGNGKGGRGSGNFGHVGRQGILGGSASMGATPVERLALGAKRHQEASGAKNPSPKRQAVVEKLSAANQLKNNNVIANLPNLPPSQTPDGDVSHDYLEVRGGGARRFLNEMANDNIEQNYEQRKDGVKFYENAGDWILNNYLRKGELPYPDERIRKKLNLPIEGDLTPDDVRSAIEKK